VVSYVSFPSTIVAPSETVTFYVNIANTSGNTDPVTITSLVSDTFGSLAGLGDCSVGFTLAPQSQRNCLFTKTISGSGGETIIDKLTASGTDDEGTPVSDDESTRIDVVAVQTPKPTPRPTPKVNRRG
jgi:hypothetical protein